jgi:N-ethylmaleimide reductase
MSKLFSPFQLGRIELSNRIVMSPMTRSRAIGNVPNERMARYYALRADAGLIVTEGTSPSPNGLGYARIPGVFSPEQIAGWRLVTDAVHAKGGRIFIQLMHTGRISHAHNMAAGTRILAPSPIAATGTMYTDVAGPQPYPTPEQMTTADIRAAIAEFVHAAESAIAAGADGIELHGANGYLIEQFLNTAVNARFDDYGITSIPNRIRFAVEVSEAVASAIGADRVAIRLSPHGVNGGHKSDADTDATYVALARELSRLQLAYVHVVDHSSLGAPPVPEQLEAALRDTFHGPLMLAGGYDKERAEADLDANRADLIAFGRPFLSNPSFVAKLRDGRALLPADPKTFFTPGDEGYLDYPVESA